MPTLRDCCGRTPGCVTVVSQVKAVLRQVLTYFFSHPVLSRFVLSLPSEGLSPKNYPRALVVPCAQFFLKCLLYKGISLALFWPTLCLTKCYLMLLQCILFSRCILSSIGLNSNPYAEQSVHLLEMHWSMHRSTTVVELSTVYILLNAILLRILQLHCFLQRQDSRTHCSLTSPQRRTPKKIHNSNATTPSVPVLTQHRPHHTTQQATLDNFSPLAIFYHIILSILFPSLSTCPTRRPQNKTLSWLLVESQDQVSDAFRKHLS